MTANRRLRLQGNDQGISQCQQMIFASAAIHLSSPEKSSVALAI
jgi:hypothetical protein